MDPKDSDFDPNKQEDDSKSEKDEPMPEEYRGRVELLDLSDDVLLCILRLCSPRDLKALGYTCPRLGALVCDRTLWMRVDAREQPTGLERMRWYLEHCLSSVTQELKVKGYVDRESRCLGIQDLSWQTNEAGGATEDDCLLRMWYPYLPRYAMSPRWPDKREVAGKAYSIDKGNNSRAPLLSQLASQIVAGASNPGPSGNNNANANAANNAASCSNGNASNLNNSASDSNNVASSSQNTASDSNNSPLDLNNPASNLINTASSSNNAASSSNNTCVNTNKSSTSLESLLLNTYRSFHKDESDSTGNAASNSGEAGCNLEDDVSNFNGAFSGNDPSNSGNAVDNLTSNIANNASSFGNAVSDSDLNSSINTHSGFCESNADDLKSNSGKDSNVNGFHIIKSSDSISANTNNDDSDMDIDVTHSGIPSNIDSIAKNQSNLIMKSINPHKIEINSSLADLSQNLPTSNLDMLAGIAASSHLITSVQDAMPSSHDTAASSKEVLSSEVKSSEDDVFLKPKAFSVRRKVALAQKIKKKKIKTRTVATNTGKTLRRLNRRLRRRLNARRLHAPRFNAVARFAVAPYEAAPNFVALNNVALNANAPNLMALNNMGLNANIVAPNFVAFNNLPQNANAVGQNFVAINNVPQNANNAVDPNLVAFNNLPQNANAVGQNFVAINNVPQYANAVDPNLVAFNNVPQNANAVGPNLVAFNNVPQNANIVGPNLVAFNNVPQNANNAVDPNLVAFNNVPQNANAVDPNLVAFNNVPQNANAVGSNLVAFNNVPQNANNAVDPNLVAFNNVLQNANAVGPNFMAFNNVPQNANNAVDPSLVALNNVPQNANAVGQNFVAINNVPQNANAVDPNLVAFNNVPQNANAVGQNFVAINNVPQNANAVDPNLVAFNNVPQNANAVDPNLVAFNNVPQNANAVSPNLNGVASKADADKPTSSVASTSDTKLGISNGVATNSDASTSNFESTLQMPGPNMKNENNFEKNDANGLNMSINMLDIPLPQMPKMPDNYIDNSPNGENNKNLSSQVNSEKGKEILVANGEASNAEAVNEEASNAEVLNGEASNAEASNSKPELNPERAPNLGNAAPNPPPANPRNNNEILRRMIRGPRVNAPGEHFPGGVPIDDFPVVNLHDWGYPNMRGRLRENTIKSKEAKEVMDAIVANCPGPQFTVDQTLIKSLRTKCYNLTSLSLEYCNLDYRATNLRHFPPNLKKLSLKGSRCYNQPINASFLGKIQDRLPALEYLDISECEWFEPSSLMPLSKLTNLQHLYMKDCKRLTECVAYASLATRYGFQKLKVLDVRGSLVADSEVSAFGWLPLLEELYVSPPEDTRNFTEHYHKWEDELAPFTELDQWETEEPDYFRCKSPSSPHFMEEDGDAGEDNSGDTMPDNYLGCTSLESRIIVIHPNRNQNERVYEVLRPDVVRLAAADLEPRPQQEQLQVPEPSNEDEIAALEADSLEPDIPPNQDPTFLEKSQNGSKELKNKSNSGATDEPLAEVLPSLGPSNEALPGHSNETLPGPSNEALPGPSNEALPGLSNEALSEPSSSKVLPGPSNEVLPGPSNEVLPGPSNESLPGPSNEVLPGPLSKILPGPSNEVLPGPSNEVLPGPSNESLPGPSNEVLPGPSSEVLPGPSNEVVPGPSDKVFPGPSNEVLPGLSNEVLPGPSNEDFPRPLNRVFPGPSNKVLPEPSNKALPGPSNDVLPGPSSSKVLPGPSNEVLPGPSHKVLPGPLNEILPGPSNEILPGPSNEVLPGPSNEVLPGPSNEVLPGPSNEVLPGPSNEVLPEASNKTLPGPSYKARPGLSKEVLDRLLNDLPVPSNEVLSRLSSNLPELPNEDKDKPEDKPEAMEDSQSGELQNSKSDKYQAPDSTAPSSSDSSHQSINHDPKSNCDDKFRPGSSKRPHENDLDLTKKQRLDKETSTTQDKREQRGVNNAVRNNNQNAFFRIRNGMPVVAQPNPEHLRPLRALAFEIWRARDRNGPPLLFPVQRNPNYVPDPGNNQAGPEGGPVQENQLQPNDQQNNEANDNIQANGQPINDNNPNNNNQANNENGGNGGRQNNEQRPMWERFREFHERQLVGGHVNPGQVRRDPVEGVQPNENNRPNENQPNENQPNNEGRRNWEGIRGFHRRRFIPAVFRHGFRRIQPRNLGAQNEHPNNNGPPNNGARQNDPPVRQRRFDFQRHGLVPAFLAPTGRSWSIRPPIIVNQHYEPVNENPQQNLDQVNHGPNYEIQPILERIRGVQHRPVDIQLGEGVQNRNPVIAGNLAQGNVHQPANDSAAGEPNAPVNQAQPNIGVLPIYERFHRFRRINNPDRPGDAQQEPNAAPQNADGINRRDYRGRLIPALVRERNVPIVHFDIEVPQRNMPHALPLLGWYLVTDSAVLRFGRADNDHYIPIGDVQPNERGVRPDRSNLRVLSITGFRNITNRSLEHLATAAPFLRRIDFSQTSVTAQGVEIFRAIRPDCEVIYSEFQQM